MILTFFTIPFLGAGQTSYQEEFDWARANFREHRDSAYSVLHQNAKDAYESKNLYWYAKNEAFIAMLEMRGGELNTAFRRYWRSYETLVSIKDEDYKLQYQILRNIHATIYNLGSHKALIDHHPLLEEALKKYEPTKEVEYRLKFQLAEAMSNIDEYMDQGNQNLRALYNDKDQPFYPYVVDRLGQNQQSLGNHQKAIEYFQEVIRVDEHKYLEGYPEYRMAQSYHAMGNTFKALDMFDASLKKMNSGYAKFETMLEKGKLFASLGQHENAVEQFESAERIYPEYTISKDYIEIDYQLGLSYLSLGMTEKSKDRLTAHNRIKTLFVNGAQEMARVSRMKNLEFMVESDRLEIKSKNDRKQRGLINISIALILAGILTVLINMVVERRRARLKRDIQQELQEKLDSL